MSVVYHYTDTGRLPHALLSGELKPGRNALGGFPDPDFLWATTSSLGDRTASASMEACRQGQTRLVRFVLHAADFEAWPAIAQQFPAWTPDQIARLERAASGKSRPQDWRCRAEPLTAERWIGVETRSYTDKVWRTLPTPWRVMPFDEKSVGVQIGTKIFVSTVVAKPAGSTGYVLTILNAEVAA